MSHQTCAMNFLVFQLSCLHVILLMLAQHFVVFDYQHLSVVNGKLNFFVGFLISVVQGVANSVMHEMRLE